MKNMVQLLAYLDRKGLKYQREEGSSLISLNFGGESLNCRVILKVDEDACIQAFSIPPINVPAGSLADVAMAVHRANYGLRLGGFELDLNDGELRYQMALPFKGDLPVDAVLDQLIHVGVAMLGRYMPAFLSVIYGNEPAKEAIALVES